MHCISTSTDARNALCMRSLFRPAQPNLSMNGTLAALAARIAPTATVLQVIRDCAARLSGMRFECRFATFRRVLAMHVWSDQLPSPSILDLASRAKLVVVWCTEATQLLKEPWMMLSPQPIVNAYFYGINDTGKGWPTARLVRRCVTIGV
jgi:hypothetical protein